MKQKISDDNKVETTSFLWLVLMIFICHLLLCKANVTDSWNLSKSFHSTSSQAILGVPLPSIWTYLLPLFRHVIPLHGSLLWSSLDMFLFYPALCNDFYLSFGFEFLILSFIFLSHIPLNVLISTTFVLRASIFFDIHHFNIYNHPSLILLVIFYH